MKMIYVGTLITQPDRDSGWVTAFKQLGWNVVSFPTMPENNQISLRKKVLRRLNIGDENNRIQRKLLTLADREQPDWVHFRLPLAFGRKTIQALTSKNIIVTQYFNDDAFSKRSPIGLHWKFRHALTAYDAHYVYRAHNIKSYKDAGASYVEHCPPTYDPKRHYIPKGTCGGDDYLADAAFIGHWEDDWRLDCLGALVRNGYSLILRGGGGLWNEAIKGSQIENLSPVTEVFGEEYNYTYSNVVAGLCFFSKINNDKWTERALEIVAVGGVLVCERTYEAQTYFKDREEAYFFSSIEELVVIIQELKMDPGRREKVRAAGYARLIADANTVSDRAAKIVTYVENNMHVAIGSR